MPYYNCKICGHRSDVTPTCEHIQLQVAVFKLVNGCLKDPTNVVEKIEAFLLQQYKKPSAVGETVNSQKWGGLSAWSLEGATEIVDKDSMSRTVVEARILNLSKYTKESVENIIEDVKKMKEVVDFKIDSENYLVIRTTADANARSFINMRLSCLHLPRVEKPDYVIDSFGFSGPFSFGACQQNDPVPVYESRRGYFVLLKIRKEHRADGDVEHNHIDCVVCGAKNVGTNEYLDLDEAEVQHIKCNNCEVKYTLVEGKWYSSEGASVYYPKDHAVTEDTKLRSVNRNDHGN